MSIRCDDCRYLFSKKRSGCPFCGGPTIQDDRPDADLLSAGYTVAPRPTENHPCRPLRGHAPRLPGGAAADPAHPPYRLLRQSRPNRNSPKVGWISSPSSRAAPLRWTSPRWTPPIVLSPAAACPQRQPTHQPDPYEAELRELERQQRRLERQYRRTALWNRLSSLRWGTVFRVVVFLLVVVTAIGLWKMRYAILNSVLNLAIGILPVVLLVWGIWMLIRSIFR